MLDIGYLNEGIESTYRKELPGKIISNGFFSSDDDGIPEIGEASLRNWKALQGYLDRGEDIRVWYSEAPHALCGFYHLCTLFRDYDNKIYVAECPRCEKGKSMWYFLRSWGMMHGESIPRYTDLTREIQKGEIELYAERWDKLVEENYPLRAVISGLPTSVSENFYDVFIERSLPKEPIKQAHLIGNVMSEDQLGVVSSWYENRVQAMIDSGMIKVIEDAEESNRRTIQRV